MATNMTCYHFNAAIVRTPSKSIINGLRAEDRGAPDYEGVTAEHEAYVNALTAAGLDVTVLPALEAYPDSVFVEDPALVFREGAVLLRPRAATRQGETSEITPVLHDMFDEVLELPEPGFADGGDILVTPNSVMIGLSDRTDKPGAAGLMQQLKKFGYKSEIVATPKGILHFKTGCSLLDEETVLVTRKMSKSGIFDGFKHMVLPDDEEPAANAVRINDVVLVSAKYERTQAMLDKSGFKVVSIGTEEIEKVDAGLSCMSLRWFRP